MKIIRMQEIEGFRTPSGVLAKELLNHKHVQVMNINLQSGDKIPPHSVPVDVFFYIVSGTGTITIGDKSKVVETTDIVICPPQTSMSLAADQDQPFVVLNVKTPSI